MTDDVCTALVSDGEERPNPLFTPPCECPRCLPDRSYDRSIDDGWLRISGHQQRYRVEPFELGTVGKSLLG